MSKRTRFSTDAAWELEDAARRVDRARPGWGDRLYVEVFDAIDHIERDAEAWQVFDGIGDERRFVLRRFPCVLIYLEMETEIVITAVVYGGREPGYWRSR